MLVLEPVGPGAMEKGHGSRIITGRKGGWGKYPKLSTLLSGLVSVPLRGQT